ncbi:hypothetical protein [Pseudomonas chlororaphis]|uniref:hypothetical protein n=1 Tax=Pseudomonas chlororaphis TaxID=587753 RepID=UPI002367F991|nr:hypothetical protein [Pseudomonas chlororaphis]WDH33917.1 hypothetical protein PUP62_24255 [Pseudomonas chlororaphis]WDH40001.1 hypothetical protein PUP51_24255 [Pseudomonas chlororaphis]
MTASAYQENPLRTTVQQMLDMQKMKEFSTEAVAGSETFTFARDKIFAILQTLKDLLEETPAELASVSGMSSINANLQTPLSEMTHFVGNDNAQHLVNAASYLEQHVMPCFWALTPPLAAVSKAAFPALLKSQSDFSQAAIRELSDQRDQLAKKLDAAIEKSDVLAQKLDDGNEAAARERAESAAAVAKLEQLFTQAEGARQLAFDTMLAEQQKLHKEEMELEAYAASKTLAEIGAFRDDAARIVQVVGNIGVTGNYQRIATAEGESANFWRWATVVIFGTGIAIAMATFYKFWHEPFSQDTAISVLIRLFYAIVITSPAIYTARESARHRTNADRARQTELELASIGPFIELLPEESKVAIRTGLTSSYFGRTTEAHTVSSPLDPEHFKNLIEVLKAAKPG